MEPVRIELSVKQGRAWRYLEDKETNEVLFGGAAGPGKTYLGCLWQIHRRMTYPKTRGLIGRSTLKNLKESTLVTLFKALGDLGYVEGVHYKWNAQDFVMTFMNKSTITMKDLYLYPRDPDFQSLGSTEYTDAFIDEATEITKKAYEIVNSRLRWKIAEYGLVPKILLTCNPSPGWIKNTFIIDEKRAPVVLKPYQKFVAALITDNPDKAYRDLYREQLSRMSSEYDKQRLIYGDWEVEREVISPFATHYDKAKHESEKAVYYPDMKLHLIFDFNLNPFAVNMAHMWRDQHGEHVSFFDEKSMPSGSIPAMCDWIKTKYGRSLPSCVVTGDSTSKKGDIGQRDNASHYIQIQRLLGLKDHQFKIPNNPTHQNSQQDVNYVLENFPDFKINPITCPDTCRDMKIVQVDAYGSIVKKNRSDTSQLSDHLDNVRYFVNTFLKARIIYHQKYGRW